MAALHSEDVVIGRLPTRNPMGFGLAPLPPSSSLGGDRAGYVGGGGFGEGGGFVGGGGLRTSHGFVGNNVAYGSGEPVGGFGGSGGISGGGGDRMFGGGGGGSSFTAPEVSPPRKTPFEEPLMFIDTTTLPSATNAFMDYSKHVVAGLVGESWRRQTREHHRNKWVNGDSAAALEERMMNRNVAHAYVSDGKKGTNTTAGTLTPDVTL